MADIVERLRVESDNHLRGTPSARRVVMQQLSEAADEIERLREALSLLLSRCDFREEGEWRDFQEAVTFARRALTSSGDGA